MTLCNLIQKYVDMTTNTCQYIDNIIRNNTPLGLNNDHFHHMTTYEYKVVDNGIGNYILLPYWDYCMKFVPNSLAPNIITAINLACSLSIWLYAEFATNPSILLIILAYVICSTLDAIDGKQARQTLTSTPFGELFDHSVDIITLFIIIRVSSIIFGVSDCDISMMYMLAGCCFCRTHYCAYIDKYVTIGLCGPNELLFVIIISYVIHPIINFGLIFQSNIIYVACIISCTILIPIYFTLDNTSASLNRSMLLVTYILWAAVIKNYHYGASYIEIICMFIIVNSRLIVIKITSAKFNNIFCICCALCLINKYVAIIVTTCIVYTLFRHIQLYLDIDIFGVRHKTKILKRY